MSSTLTLPSVPFEQFTLENGKYESSNGWDSLQYEYDRPIDHSFQVVASTRKAGKAARVIVRQGYSPFGYNESTEMARDFSDQLGADPDKVQPPSWMSLRL